AGSQARQASTNVTPTLPDATVNEDYGPVEIVAKLGTPEYRNKALVALPPGNGLTKSGQLYGTPTTIGAWPVHVQVTDALDATTERQLTLNVTGPGSLAVAGTGSNVNMPSAGEADHLLGEFTFTAGVVEDVTLEAMTLRWSRPAVATRRRSRPCA
ncbi:MAG: hypothetical protein AB7K09_22615, partial [Planctomycetota bacterium]